VGISYSGNRADVLESSYLTGTLAVSITQVEAKVGVSALAERQLLIIQNKGANSVYIGPTGVTSTTGFKLEKNAYITMAISGDISVFLICEAAQSATVVIQELA
jgi:hypothetical protein